MRATVILREITRICGDLIEVGLFRIWTAFEFNDVQRASGENNKIRASTALAEQLVLEYNAPQLRFGMTLNELSAFRSQNPDRIGPCVEL